MSKNKCIVCNNTRNILVWNDKIRTGQKTFSKKKYKIFKCTFCNLVFLGNKSKKLEDSSFTRNLYNKNNSIKEFFKFHTPREIKKINFVKKYVNFRNKKILESNCGAGILINHLKKKTKFTAGLDNVFYKNFVKSNNHDFYASIDEIIKKKTQFDIILSFSEIEHKFDPIKFLKKIKKILSKNGKIILRIPNYFNFYMFLVGKNFLKYDYRQSHNYYFSEKNLDLIFKNLNFNIKKKIGFNEYSFNHLLTYSCKQKRVKSNQIKTFLNKKIDSQIVKNIEKNYLSTSLIYILSNV